MASTPDGTVIDVITEEGEDGPPSQGFKKDDREEHSRNLPTPHLEDITP